MMPRTTQIGYARSGIGPTCHRLREGLGRRATGMFRDVTALVAPLAHFARFSRRPRPVMLPGWEVGCAGTGRAGRRRAGGGYAAGWGRGPREVRAPGGPGRPAPGDRPDDQGLAAAHAPGHDHAG